MFKQIKRHKSNAKKEMQYSINKLIKKYENLENRVAAMERASRKKTGSQNYWDKTQ